MGCGAHHKRLGGAASMILMVGGNMTGVIDSWKMISSNATAYIHKFNKWQNLVIKLVVNLINKINTIIYFENLTVELHVFYALNTHVKFCVNQISFTIWFISLYFVHNFKL